MANKERWERVLDLNWDTIFIYNNEIYKITSKSDVSIFAIRIDSENYTDHLEIDEDNVHLIKVFEEDLSVETRLVLHRTAEAISKLRITME